MTLDLYYDNNFIIMYCVLVYPSLDFGNENVTNEIE